MRVEAFAGIEDGLRFRLGGVRVWLNAGATAHILGGPCWATRPKDGCVDPVGKLFGGDDFRVLDGSALPANPGVNPSLTIAGMAEQAMSPGPEKA